MHSNGLENTFLKQSAPLLIPNNLFLKGGLLLMPVSFHCELVRGLSVGMLIAVHEKLYMFIPVV